MRSAASADRNRELTRQRYHNDPAVRERVRAYRETEAFRAAKREEYRRYSKTAKHKAHRFIQKAIKCGVIERKPCEWCGNPDAVAHHWDYNKPSEVEWFCRPHHALIHRADRAHKRKLSNG